MAEYRPVSVPGLPRFVGGAVGFLAYDVVRSFEPIPAYPKDELKTPLFAFCITDTLLIFDNVAHTIKVVANAHIASTTKRQSFDGRIKKPLSKLNRSLPSYMHLDESLRLPKRRTSFKFSIQYDRTRI